jgi:hypothetical protein
MALNDRLFASLRTDLIGVTDPLLTSKLWEVIQTMCREGWLWRETIEVTLSADDSTYTLAPAGAEVVHVISLDHETLDLYDSVYEFGVLTLGTAPTAGDAAEPLYVSTVLTPSLTAGEDVENLIPEDMWSEHFDLMRRGMLAEFLGMPAKPWTNPQLAAFYYRDFRGKLATARRKVEVGNVRGGQLWRFPKWA